MTDLVPPGPVPLGPVPRGPVPLGVNANVRPLVERLLRDAGALGVRVDRSRGVCIVDAGIDAPGSLAAGLLVAEICMGGHGSVSLRQQVEQGWPTWLQVASPRPVLACLASQYAGWSLSATREETGGRKFFALGSGPARALAAKEPLFAELDHRETGDTGVLVMEVDRPPPDIVVDKVLRDCGLAPEGLTLVLTPTTSPAGTTQVVARVLEVALHRAHGLGFALHDIVEGVASAPLPPPDPDGVQAMGRTNDAILYGGRVQLSVRGDDAAARDLAARLPSRNSPDHGRPFAELFAQAGFDFYKIDPGLFAPAEVWVTSLVSGLTWHAGGTDLDLLVPAWCRAA